MKKSELGQALLIVLLVLTVGLTISLSIVSRSITDIRISQQEEESARAFSVAEAGIEDALGMNLAAGSSHTDIVGGIEYHVSATGQGSEPDFNLGKFEEGDTQTVWLIEHTNGGLGGYSFPATGTITVCWGDGSESIAVEVSLLYKDASGEFQVTRGAYDANPARGNEFERADRTGGGNCGDLQFAHDIDLGADLGVPPNAILYALRLKLLYNDTPQPLAVSGSSSFPSQGKCYVSTATVPESGITRKVQQCQFHEAPPGIFDYVLFSGEDLIK